MKAVEIRQTGGPEVLVYTELPDPVAAPGEVLIQVAAIGVNYSDVVLRLGRYPLPFPAVPGIEAAGAVADVGEGVTGLSRGDAVVFVGAADQPRAYAEMIAAPADRVLKLPPGVDLQTGAAVALQGITAHYLSHDCFALRPGHTAVVHAAAGGVGLLLTQMAKLRGARVIACVSSQFKAELATAAGADATVRYDLTELSGAVMEITAGRGADVVYDSVGAQTVEASLACLARRGFLVLFGQSSGPVPSVATAALVTRSLYLTRPQLADYTATRDELEGRAATVFGWVTSGALRARVHHAWPLSNAAEAHRQLEGRLTSGKLLLVPED